MNTTALDKAAKGLAIFTGLYLPTLVSAGASDGPQGSDLNALTGPAVAAPLTNTVNKSARVNPRTQGVNLTFSPAEFNYVHEYQFKDLSAEAKSVYFLLPRNCQEHTIRSVSYSVGGAPLKYDVVAESPGWKVARAEVPPSRNFSVRMEVSGIHWNGKLANGSSDIPEDIAPPQITDEMMSWYKASNPTMASARDDFNKFRVDNGLDKLGDDFVSAFTKAYTFMAQNMVYQSGANTFVDSMNGKANCNGSNGFLSGVFDLESSGQYVGVELNGITMAGKGEIHAMSLVGKKDWTLLVPTDAVKFDNKNLDPHYLSGTSMGPMLIFQEGLGDPATNPKGGVTYQRPENGRTMRVPNPGGSMTAFDASGNVILNGASLGGIKVQFTSTPITDFVALRRELGLVAKASSNDAAASDSSEIQGGATQQQGGGTPSWDFGAFSMPNFQGIGLQAK